MSEDYQQILEIPAAGLTYNDLMEEVEAGIERFRKRELTEADYVKWRAGLINVLDMDRYTVWKQGGGQ